MMFITDECQPTLEERYFLKIRPQLYKLHASHYQYGVRKGTSLAEHLDSVCQFLLTITRIAGVPEEKRGIILAVGVTHDLNKLDESGRSVKKLARDRAFLQEQLELAGVSTLVKTEEDYELVRRLIERHSGHSASDGMRFFPEDGNIKKWAAMLIGADLFDLGIGEEKRLRKVENELTIALGRPCQLFLVRLSEDKGYLTSLLLGACEEVLMK
jgi:CRISPR-associated protein Csc3